MDPEGELPSAGSALGSQGNVPRLKQSFGKDTSAIC